ncbi:MAG: phage portal protein [Duncaniella sp.]|nr:phage portal protein [Duncaniella sp.]
MGFLSKFFNREKRGVSEGENATEPTPRTGYPWLLTEGGALCVASVYCCVKLLSESVANLPLLYQRLRGGIFREDTASRLHYLLTVQPNPAVNAFDFWAQAVQNMLLDGNAYIVPVYGSGLEPANFILCGRGTVAHDVFTDTYSVTDMVNGISDKFREDEMIHLKLFSLDGKRGISVLSHARLTTAIAATGDRETLDRFENGGNIRGIIGKDKAGLKGFNDYSNKQSSALAQDVDRRFRDGQRIVSIPQDVDFKQISLSSTDMQFLESRKFSVKEICRFFRVHPSFVFEDGGSNYKSAENASVDFLKNTLNPILRRIETELHRKLVPDTMCCKRRFRFDRTGLYDCDLESKANYQGKMIANGMYTVNELRQMENRPAVQGGDRVLVSANLKGINELDAAPGKVQDVEESVKTDKDDDE